MNARVKKLTLSLLPLHDLWTFLLHQQFEPNLIESDILTVISTTCCKVRQTAINAIRPETDRPLLLALYDCHLSTFLSYTPSDINLCTAFTSQPKEFLCTEYPAQARDTWSKYHVTKLYNEHPKSHDRPRNDWKEL